MRSHWKRATARVDNEGGFVVLVVVLGLLVMSLVAASALLTSDDEYRSSQALREWGSALNAAEAGLHEIRALWPDTLANKLLPGDSAVLPWRKLDNGAGYRAVIQRYDNGVIGQKVFGLHVEGRGAGPLGGRRVLSYIMTPLSPPSLPKFPGPIGLVNGGASPPIRTSFVGTSFSIQGGDQAMPSASDPLNVPAGCSLTSTSQNTLGISVQGATSSGVVDASVASQQRDNITGLLPGSTTNQYTSEGSWGSNSEFTMTASDVQALFDQLRPFATPLPTGNYDKDLGTATNPGIWVVDGHIGLQGSGRGFGILLVNGDVSINAAYVWEGVMIVVGDGKVTSGGTASKVFGSVLVANTNGGKTELYLAGKVGYNFSTQAICRVEKQLLGLGTAKPLSSRAWSQAID